MPPKGDRALRPRKLPVQARSTATVSALFEASIQVLLAVGYRKLTTTRVAERAGVSVGTLYQYFPDRRALVAAVVARYLDELSSSIERDCADLKGCSLEEIATGLVDAFIAAKWRRIDVSRAMHEPLGDVGGLELVRAAGTRGAKLVSDILRNCRGAAFDDVESTSVFIVSACSALLQAAVTGHAGPVEIEELRTHMRAMALGYLREMRRAEPSARSRLRMAPS
jgi:AcrR family transcriptional regulator